MTSSLLELLIAAKNILTKLKFYIRHQFPRKLTLDLAFISSLVFNPLEGPQSANPFVFYIFQSNTFLAPALGTPFMPSIDQPLLRSVNMVH